MNNCYDIRGAKGGMKSEKMIIQLKVVKKKLLNPAIFELNKES